MPDLTPPTIGRIVLYRSKRNPYDLPAVVTATKDSLWHEGVLRGDVPKLSSETHLHLHVMTPGPLGSYQEHDIPQFVYDPENPKEPTPGSWRWPERVDAATATTLEPVEPTQPEPEEDPEPVVVEAPGASTTADALPPHRHGEQDEAEE